MKIIAFLCQRFCAKPKIIHKLTQRRIFNCEPCGEWETGAVWLTFLPVFPINPSPSLCLFCKFLFSRVWILSFRRGGRPGSLHAVAHPLSGAHEALNYKSIFLLCFAVLFELNFSFLIFAFSLSAYSLAICCHGNCSRRHFCCCCSSHNYPH